MPGVGDIIRFISSVCRLDVVSCVLHETRVVVAYRLVTFVLLDEDCAGGDVFVGVDAMVDVWFAMFMIATGLSAGSKMGCIL
jgi:hypothetical protein